MPERRQEHSGRRSTDAKAPPKETPPPPAPVPPREEAEPDRSHPLHRKIGGKR